VTVIDVSRVGGEARADRAGTRSAFDEHEVGLRRPGREAGGGQPRAEEATLLADPSHMDAQRLGAAPELGEGERNRWRRHGIRAARRAQHGYDIRAPDGVPHPAAGEAPGLGQRTQYQDIGKIEHRGSEVLVGVLDVHVIEDDERVRRRRGHAPDIGQRRDAPRRIVRRHDRDDGSARVQPAHERAAREGVVPPRDADELTAGECGTAIEHVEAGVRQHQGTAGLEKGPARAIDPLVCPGCHQQAVRRDADPGGEGGFEGGDVRVTAQQLRVCVGEIAEQGARWQDTLIRVEAKHAGTARRTPVGGGRVDPRHRTGRRSGGRGRHGTICEKVETTRSVPPAAFTAGITCGNASRGTAAFTA